MPRLLVEEVIASALEYAELSEDGAGGPSRVLSLYNSAASDLHNLLVRADENYAVKTTGSTAITVDRPLYNLPDDFMRSRKVFIVDNGRHFPCRPFTVDEVDGHDVDDITAGNYDLWYVPRYRRVKDASEEVPFIMIDGWEEYVAWYMATILLGKRGEDPAFALTERRRLEKSIVETAEQRDEEPGRIIDESGRWDLRSAEHHARNSGVIRFYSIEGAQVRFLEVS